MTVQNVDIASFLPDAEKYLKSVINIHTNGDMIFEYLWNGVLYTFSGKEQAAVEGKFILHTSDGKNRVTLYRLPGNEGFIGRWYETGIGYGLWEINFSE